jgi:hypothetical protein
MRHSPPRQGTVKTKTLEHASLEHVGNPEVLRNTTNVLSEFLQRRFVVVTFRPLVLYDP